MTHDAHTRRRDRRFPRPTLAACAVVLSAAAGFACFPRTASAQDLTFSVDVPSDLARLDVLANQTVRHDAGVYTLAFDGPLEGLGPDVNLVALELLESGAFLFSTDVPFGAQGTDYDADDLIRFENGVYSLHLDGASLGLPDGVGIDALSRDASGDVVLSFDVPVAAGGSTFDASDLVRVSGGVLSTFLSATTMGLPADANVVGLETRDDGGVLLQFDTPLDLGGSTYLPGDVVARDAGGAWSLFFRDGGFPPGSAATDFGLPASPGGVEQLRLAKNGAQVDLSWDASCSTLANDYAVYEGTLGDFTSHQPKACSTAGALATTVAPDAGSRYFLIVPRSDATEGSYGVDGTGAERPSAAGACLPERKARACA